MTDPIIVVGAGVAGLVCAIELQRAGRQVVVLEAGPEVGGRVRTTTRDGLAFDHGFQVLFTAYPTLRSYLDLDALAPRVFRPAARIVQGGRASLIGDALSDPSLLIDTIMARAVPLSDKVRLLLLRRFAQRLSIDECFTARFAGVSTREFLASRGFSASVIDGFFAPFYGGILLDRTLATSASVLLFTFKMLAEGKTVVPARGMGALTQQLAARLVAGTVRTGVAVQSLTVGEGRATGVVLAGGEVLPAAQVIIATDAPAAARLAATAGVQIATPSGARGTTTLYFTTRGVSPIPGRALWLNADAAAVISHAVTITDVAPDYAPRGVSLIAASAVGDAADRSDAELESAARRELAAMAIAAGDAGAEMKTAALSRVAIWRVPYAQFAQPPGWQDHRPTVACGIAGLWRASEVLHSSSLEGAARGGQDAARAVLHSH
jgi:phytoene dehydrogenase-like protein